MSRILVGVSGASHFELPPCVPQLSTELGIRLRRTAKTGIALWILLGIFSFILFYAFRDKWFLAFGAVMLLMTAIMTMDLFLGIDDSRGVSERTMFFYWLQTAYAPRLAFFVFGLIGVGVGIVQFLLQRFLGGLEPLIMKYGFYYASVRDGELWRVLFVPFFHSGVVHFLNNYFMIIFVAPIAWGMAGPKRTFVVFFGACYLTPFLQMLCGADSFDSYLGSSAGLFGMLGLIVGMDLTKKSVLPKRFIINIFGVATLSIVVSELVSTSAATISHIAGFIIGGLFSIFPREEMAVTVR